VVDAVEVAAEAEDSMVDTLGVVIDLGTLEDSAAAIPAVDTVLLLYLEHPMEGIALLLYLGDPMPTAAGIMVGIVADTMAVIEEDIIEDTMAGVIMGVITPTGDYGDGGIGDGLFWDGLMLVGLTMPMEGIRI